MLGCGSRRRPGWWLPPPAHSCGTHAMAAAPCGSCAAATRNSTWRWRRCRTLAASPWPRTASGGPAVLRRTGPAPQPNLRRTLSADHSYRHCGCWSGNTIGAVASHVVGSAIARQQAGGRHLNVACPLLLPATRLASRAGYRPEAPSRAAYGPCCSTGSWCELPRKRSES